jgi:phosphatidylglycerol lysyltransferase
MLLLRATVGPRPKFTERRAARDLLRVYGRAGTSYMTLWKGNSLFFDAPRDCYIAYRVQGAVAVALGDPIGPDERWLSAINAFAAFAERQGWDHVFYGATPAALVTYRSLGYETLQIGEEAIIYLEGIEFRGNKWQHMRTAINRAKREGIQFHMYEGGTIPESIREQLFAISAEWEAHNELPPMGFTLGTTSDVEDPNVNVAVAIGTSGRVHAFVDWLPIYARNGWVIDLMRRRSDAMSGAMNFLIGMSFLEFRERGYKLASLSAAPLAVLDRDEDSSMIQKLLGQVFERFGKYYDFRSLFDFKEKFQPEWEGVYLVYRGTQKLPSVGRAVLRCHLPELDTLAVARLLGSAVAERLFAKKDANAASPPPSPEDPNTPA